MENSANWLRTVSILALVVSCGDPEDASRGGDGGSIETAPPSTEATGEGDTSDDADASNTANSSSAEGGDTDSATSAADSGDSSSVPGFDVASPDGGAACGGGSGDGEGGTLSYIWIANSSEGTVSKINTTTMVEEGRYIVRSDSAGSPSRTSVSLSGDVAIANRIGGVTKIYGNSEDCAESNGVPGLQTSSGGADILAWGTEECVAWHTPLAYSSNRPMAWAQGDWSEAGCLYENEKLWTAGSNGAGTAQVLLLDGDTGAVEQTVDIPEIQSSIGLYGGAVDGDGHFWGIETGGVRLVRVDRDAFTYQLWNGPGVASYGIAVDSVGRPWFCAGGGASRFDPVLQTWQTLPSPGGNAWGGCMTDGQGTLWHCRQQDSMLVGIDTENLTVVAQHPLPAYAHGISVDFSGYVWAVGFVSTDAYRVDPMTGGIDTFTGLVAAYTYSDMTGFALSTAGVPSG